MILVFGRLYVNREEICRQKQVVRTGFFFKNDTEIHGGVTELHRENNQEKP
jgi:hypothetical protein